MVSIVRVDKLDPQSGTALEIGTSGDTINIPSGVTIANSGTATGFGMTGWSTGGTSNSFIPSATDQGVYLGVTSATAANLLDDYEEGNWTPSYYGLGGTTPPTYSVQSGKYTKVGRSVTLTGTLTITAHNATGNMNLSGFPFNVGGSSDNGYYAAWDYYMGGAGWQNLPAADYSGYTGVNTDRAPMHYVDSGEGHGETYFLIQTVCATSGTCILNFRLNYFTE